MVGSMTIITTFITPYMVKIGWKVADAIGSVGSSGKDNKKIWQRPLSLKEREKRDNQQQDWLYQNIRSIISYYVTLLSNPSLTIL